MFSLTLEKSTTFFVKKNTLYHQDLCISSSPAQSIQTKGKHIYQTASEPTQLKTSYLDVKMLQNKTINHSFCKFKLLLLILEDYPYSI